ncbi:hypothetical protein KFK09_015912 [Dendrobium nobile]|uniref:Uncharacterized protein n=1 Tax=Dendrobium nobile TaxID=94219 RepID=A0A8T3B7L7_DENNO|nr:hypothetical protein KFK09_015912 [Dendrobium nobile]
MLTRNPPITHVWVAYLSHQQIQRILFGFNLFDKPLSVDTTIVRLPRPSMDLILVDMFYSFESKGRVRANPETRFCLPTRHVGLCLWFDE